MSARIVIEFETNDEKKSIEARRYLEGDKTTALEKKLLVYYLFGMARGLAETGIEQKIPTLVSESAAFLAMALDIYEHATEEERKA